MTTPEVVAAPTWQDNAGLCVYAIAQYADSPINKDVGLPNLRRQLDRLIDESQIDDRDRLFELDWIGEFMALAATANWVAANYGEAIGLDAELTKLLARKQHDYGPENILRFGVPGLMVRLHDKVARLENLLAKRDGKNAVNGEAVADTFTDIVGYCVIGMMLVFGTFTLPLGSVA